MRIFLIVCLAILATGCATAPASKPKDPFEGFNRGVYEFNETLDQAVVKPVDQVADNEMILDIGPDTAAHLASLLKDAGTILWNGPVGVFEIDQFGKGTEVISRAIADSAAFSIAGGGDTLAAIDKYAIADQVSYISTGGGAFLEYVEGKQLPAVAALEAAAQR